MRKTSGCFHDPASDGMFGTITQMPFPIANMTDAVEPGKYTIPMCSGKGEGTDSVSSKLGSSSWIPGNFLSAQVSC